MPMHDWTRVADGTFHAFHNAWITHLQEALNSGLLPDSYYALGEPSAGDISTDLSAQEAKSDLAFYLSRKRSVVIRHVSGDRVVAVIEILSPANKHSQQTVDTFVDKVVGALREGVHMSVIDPFPPTRYDPLGIHGAVWHRLMAGAYEAPPGSGFARARPMGSRATSFAARP